MKYLLAVLIVFTCNLFCAGQISNINARFDKHTQYTSIKPLMIGDPVPDVELLNVLNWKSTKIRTSDFKGKLVILDFWSKNCASCIRGFPKMDELQEKYKDKIQILLVTYNSFQELESLFQRSKYLKNTRLPIILTDTILHKLFPNEGLPYYVWFDGNRITVAKTWPMQVTKEYIERVLNGQKLPRKIMKEETLMDFDFQAPMVMEGGGRQWKYLAYYSMIMKRVPNIQKAAAGPIQDPVTKEYLKGSFFATNFPMLTFFRVAYSMKDLTPVVIEVENASRYYQPKNQEDYLEWLDNYSFCYEQVLPPEKQKFKNLILKKDLEQYFGLTGTREQRVRDCFVLYRLDSIDRLKSKYTIETVDIDNDSLNSVLKFRYNTINSIIAAIISDHKYDYDQPVIIDQTGYSGNIDVHFTVDLSDLEKLRQELGVFGLGIKTEARTIECLILRKNEFWTELISK